MKNTSTCRNCQKEFKSFPSCPRAYCSRKCYNTHWKQSYVGKDLRKIVDIPPLPIEDEVTAYFLGFFQADGSLQKKTLTIEINEKDKNILFQFQKKFGGKVITRTRDTNFKDNVTTYIWRLGSVLFVRQLNNLGFPSGKKCHRTKLLDTKPELKRHYLRGLVDGDGSLGYCKGNKPFLGFVTDSEEMKEGFFNFLEEFGIENNIQRNKRDNIYNFMIMNEKAIMITNYLYSKSKIHLDRKKKIAESFNTWKPKTSHRRNWSETEDKILESFNFDYKKVIKSKKIDRTALAIRIRCVNQKENHVSCIRTARPENSRAV